MIKVLPYDSAEFLRDVETVEDYMNEAFATEDPRLIAHALGTVARARSMTEIARKTGLSRESLYRALSADGRPELATVLKVMGALGLKLSTRRAPVSSPKVKVPVKPKAAKAAKRVVGA